MASIFSLPIWRASSAIWAAFNSCVGVTRRRPWFSKALAVKELAAFRLKSPTSSTAWRSCSACSRPVERTRIGQSSRSRIRPAKHLLGDLLFLGQLVLTPGEELLKRGEQFRQECVDLTFPPPIKSARAPTCRFPDCIQVANLVTELRK